MKNNVAVLNIGITNHIFDSLKIGTGNESVVRIRTLDTIVFDYHQFASMFAVLCGLKKLYRL